jgi:hypothetical protein
MIGTTEKGPIRHTKKSRTFSRCGHMGGLTERNYLTSGVAGAGASGLVTGFAFIFFM